MDSKLYSATSKVGVALVGLVAGIAVALGFNESLVATISGGVLSVVSVVLMALMGVKTAKTAATQGSSANPDLHQKETEPEESNQDGE